MIYVNSDSTVKQICGFHRLAFGRVRLKHRIPERLIEFSRFGLSPRTGIQPINKISDRSLHVYYTNDVSTCEECFNKRRPPFEKSREPFHACIRRAPLQFSNASLNLQRASFLLTSIIHHNDTCPNLHIRCSL